MILHHEFVKAAKQKKSELAIIDKSTERKVTFEKALIGSLIFSNKFKKLKDQFVGLMVPTSAGAYLANLGLLMTGKVPVMINYSTGIKENCEYAKDLIGFDTIITSKSLLEKLKAPKLKGMIFLEDLAQQISMFDKAKALLQSKLPAEAIIKRFPEPEIDDTIAILFTSGSESSPKAVQLSHRNIGSNVSDIISILGLKEDDKIFNALPIFHVFGLTTGLWTPFILKVPVVTVANPLEFKNIPRFIREEKPTLIPGTPTFFAAYSRESKPGDFESVRIMVPGADKTPEWLRKEYRNKHNIELYEGYGTTETSPVITTNSPTANKPGSVGKEVPSARVKIVDLDTGKDLPTGEEGKILVKGDLVMKGYFDDLEATSFRIRDGWYDTGDMGVMDEEGFLWHRGRLKRFVKIGGEMVSMVKVEQILYELLPEDIECCVVEIPDSRKGSRIIAAVTGEINQKEIKKQLSERLPSIAIPKEFRIFPELPKMGNGKIDFKTVTKMVRDQSRE